MQIQLIWSMYLTFYLKEFEKVWTVSGNLDYADDSPGLTAMEMLSVMKLWLRSATEVGKHRGFFSGTRYAKGQSGKMQVPGGMMGWSAGWK